MAFSAPPALGRPALRARSLPVSHRSRRPRARMRPRPVHASLPAQPGDGANPRADVEGTHAGRSESRRAGARADAPGSSTGVESANVSVRSGVQGGRGVVASRAIAPGAVVARVPEAAALVVCFADALPDSARDGYPFPEGAWVSRAHWDVADWDAKLAALLLFHRAEGARSPWARYIASLPGPAALWTAADLPPDAAHDLQYTPMLDAVEVYRFRLVAEYDRFRAALPAHRREAVPRELFAWALKVVHSRAFSIPPGGFAASATRTGLRSARGGPAAVRAQQAQQDAGGGGGEWPRKFALVPLLDMMNHGDGGHIAKFRFDSAGAAFELVAGPDGYEAGSQVLVSYGTLTNDDLLLLYGFVQAGNPSDVYEVEDDVADWVGEHASNKDWNVFQRKVALLEAAGLSYEGRKFFISRTGVDEHLIAALRVLLAAPDELAALARAQRATPAAADATAAAVPPAAGSPPREWYAPVSARNEMQVWAMVERHCDRMLAEFPTSLDADEEMIILLAAGSAEPDMSVSAPLLFRVEKKRILRDAVQLAAVKQLCIATNVDAESEQSLLRKVSDAKPPPPETWVQGLLHGGAGAELGQ